MLYDSCKFASPMWRVLSAAFECRHAWVESIGRDRVHLSQSLHSKEKRRKSSRKTNRDGEGKGWNYLLVSRRKLLFGNMYIREQTHHVVKQRLACARKKTHRKNRITTSAFVRNIKNIRWGNTRSVERENKAENALASKNFIDASLFCNEIWRHSLRSQDDLMYIINFESLFPLK